jgi:hypothetical protein
MLPFRLPLLGDVGLPGCGGYYPLEQRAQTGANQLRIGLEFEKQVSRVRPFKRFNNVALNKILCDRHGIRSSKGERAAYVRRASGQQE